MKNTDPIAGSNSVKATIKLETWNETPTIDEICAPLEEQGYVILSAWIQEEN